jgi:hypothetical protein
MKQYHKIKNVFRRDEHTHKLIPNEWTCPEYDYLQDVPWTATEKVEGMNIRVLFNNPDTELPLEFRGKSDKALLPPSMRAKLPELFTIDKLRAVFDRNAPLEKTPVCLYGEGYGQKIQKGGGDYIPDGVGFILFDVKIGRWWIKRSDLEIIAEKLEIPIVPIVICAPLHKCIQLVRHRLFHSELKNTPPEGLVCKPEIDLFNRRGERIITKIKGRDFD